MHVNSVHKYLTKLERRAKQQHKMFLYVTSSLTELEVFLSEKDQKIFTIGTKMFVS
jgi:hypothetical protein